MAATATAITPVVSQPIAHSGRGRMNGPMTRGCVWRQDYLVAIVAVLGTTITPYCFFWQSSEEAEDERINPAAHRLIDAPDARIVVGGAGDQARAQKS
jgi:Mn2+/Fe2+ NRAMP family transporter